MDVRIQITDSDNELKFNIERQLHIQLEKLVLEKLKTIDFDSLIEKRVDYLIDRSKYVSDSIIRNLVQQRIAKEITKDILNP